MPKYLTHQVRTRTRTSIWRHTHIRTHSHTILLHASAHVGAHWCHAHGSSAHAQPPSASQPPPCAWPAPCTCHPMSAAAHLCNLSALMVATDKGDPVWVADLCGMASSVWDGQSGQQCMATSPLRCTTLLCQCSRVTPMRISPYLQRQQ